MAFNATVDAFQLSFNQQTAVIAGSFVASLLSCVLLAAVLFGVMACRIPLTPLQINCWREDDVWCDRDSGCCIFFSYVGYKWCPSCCRCSEWRRQWDKESRRMQHDIEQIEMDETSKRVALEHEERLQREERELREQLAREDRELRAQIHREKRELEAQRIRKEMAEEARRNLPPFSQSSLNNKDKDEAFREFMAESNARWLSSTDSVPKGSKGQ